MVIGLLILMQFANVAFVGPLAPINRARCLLFLFVLWIWVAKGVAISFVRPIRP
jgi:hypothetical protein